VLADPAVLATFDSTTTNLDDLLPSGCPDLNHMREHAAPELPFSREACWVAKSSRERAGILGPQRGAPDERFGTAVAVSTGVGDGLYPVYAEISEPSDVDGEDFLVGRVARVLVDFQILASPPAELIRCVFTEEDVGGIAEREAVPFDVALARAHAWSKHIAERASTLIKEHLESVVRSNQP
jgi:hypothetical protein